MEGVAVDGGKVSWVVECNERFVLELVTLTYVTNMWPKILLDTQIWRLAEFHGSDRNEANII